jgi:hypothetical protein
MEAKRLRGVERALKFWLIFCLLPFLGSFSLAQAPSSESQSSGNSTQQSTPKPPSSAPQEPQPKPEAPVSARTKNQQEKEIERKEQSQRVLGVLPQFAVTSRQNAPSLTPWEKFHLFARSAFDPVQFGIVGLQAGLSQATDEFPEYGQGAQGYGKRYGAALADEVSAGFWSNFWYPVLLRQDPRYFRRGEGSFKHRVFYGIRQEFVAHADHGGRAFNFSNVLGAFTAGGISNAYYPSSDRGFGLTMSRSAIALAYGMAGGLFDEFYPDIHDKLLHKRKKAQSP